MDVEWELRRRRWWHVSDGMSSTWLRKRADHLARGVASADRGFEKAEIMPFEAWHCLQCRCHGSMAKWTNLKANNGLFQGEYVIVATAQV